jgi:hypothetical protein
MNNNSTWADTVIDMLNGEFADKRYDMLGEDQIDCLIDYERAEEADAMIDDFEARLGVSVETCNEARDFILNARSEDREIHSDRA